MASFTAFLTSNNYLSLKEIMMKDLVWTSISASGIAPCERMGISYSVALMPMATVINQVNHNKMPWWSHSQRQVPLVLMGKEQVLLYSCPSIYCSYILKNFVCEINYQWFCTSAQMMALCTLIFFSEFLKSFFWICASVKGHSILMCECGLSYCLYLYHEIYLFLYARCLCHEWNELCMCHITISCSRIAVCSNKMLVMRRKKLNLFSPIKLDYRSSQYRLIEKRVVNKWCK